MHIQQNYQSEFSGAIDQLQKPNTQRARVDHPCANCNLPTSSVCQVEPISPQEAKFNEFVLVGPEGERSVRKVVRTTRDSVYLSGGPSALENYRGPILRIKSASFQGIDLSISPAPKLDTLKEWFVSLVSSCNL